MHALLKKYLDLTVKDDRGRTALRCARDNYQLELVRALLESWDWTRQEAEDKDKQEKSLMHWAAELGDERLCRQLGALDLDRDALVPDQQG